MKHRIFSSAAFIALAFVSSPAFAMYMPVETKDIPLRRLLENLDEKAKASPSNPEILHKLARTHAIAYSQRLADTTPVKSWTGWSKKDPESPWFGYEPPHVPFNQVTKTQDEQKLAEAKWHLTAAIATYQKALAAKPNDTIMMLGLAWCQEQAGEKTSAIAGYRKVAAAAWEQESKSGGGLGNFVYVETVGYLVPLLDATKDAAEIAEMNDRKQKLLSLPRAVTPIIVPVDHDADDLDSLVDSGARVAFDLDGSGRQLEWPWITPKAAWLVFDPEKTGKITSSIRMFGSRSFLLFCDDGYDALSLLDDNGDASIRGAELCGLALWRDLNSNGVSESGEVTPVSDCGITSLSTVRQTHSSGIPYSRRGVIFEGGSSRPTYDLILKSK